MTRIAKYLSEKPEKLLIIAPSWIGDAVMSQPLLAKLKQQYPDCLIDIMAPPWVKPIFGRMAEVHDILDSPLVHKKLNWSGICQSAKTLKEKKYDQAIVLPNSFKSGLIAFKAGIPVRRGYLGEMRYGLINDIVRPDPKKTIRLIDRYLKIADAKHYPMAVNDGFMPPSLLSFPEKQEKLLHQFGLTKDIPLICICPGAEYGPAKQWPIHHVAKLVELLSQNKYQICLIGSQKDNAAAIQVLAQLPQQENCLNLCGKTTLEDAIDFLAIASAAVVNDSGLMHVACAVHIPVFALYGSSNPAYTPPVSEKASVIINKQPCSPCFERTCRFGHYACLESILPEHLFEKIAAIL